MRKALHRWDCNVFTLTRAAASQRLGTNKYTDAATADAPRRPGTYCGGITATLRLRHCLSTAQITPAGGTGQTPVSQRAGGLRPRSPRHLTQKPAESPPMAEIPGDMKPPVRENWTQLLLRTLQGRTLVHCAAPDDTGEQLHKQIAERTHIPAGSFYLTHRGRKVCPHTPIGS